MTSYLYEQFLKRPARKLGLAAWYLGSMPYRALAAARAQKKGAMPIAVVCYHRVADDALTDWTISNRHFLRHIRFFQKHFDLVSLSDAQRWIHAGYNDRPALCITFDDGYADNFTQAIPFLIRERIPFAYFVTHRHITSGEAFPHDAEKGLHLTPNTPDQIRALADAGVEIGSHTRTHPDLGQVHDEQVLRDEVLTASQDLERIAGRAIRYFAFPYGRTENLSARAISLLRAAGFAGVCSAYGDYNYPGDDPFHIRRNCLDASRLRTANWVTLDPRKVREGKLATESVAPLFKLDLRPVARLGENEPGRIPKGEPDRLAQFDPLRASGGKEPKA